MISDKYKCVFVHIPKVAGQSVEKFFLKRHGLDWDNRESLLLRYNPEKNKGPERLAHLVAQEYVNCGYLKQEIFDSYFKFAFVRNPWDRLVSEFTYRDDYKHLSFKEFLLNRLPEQSQYTDSYRHIMPQTKFLYDDEGTQLVDFIGRFENLQSDFSYVCSKLNIESTTLPHTNVSSINTTFTSRVGKILKRNKKSKRKHYTEYYDEQLREIVASMYANDISTFNYTFDD